MGKSLFLTAALVVALSLATAADAEDYVLTLKDNQFAPTVLTVPAGQKIRISVKNLDATPAEFESSDLNREKLVGAKSEIILFIGPLDAGSYSYFDDFHRATTTGLIIAQ